MGLEGTIATVVGAVLTAFFTGLFTFLGVRRKGKTDVQQSLNIGFETLIKELQEERTFLREERTELRAMIAAQAREVNELEERVRRLILMTTTYHNFIVAAGLVPPEIEVEKMNKNEGDVGK